MGRAKSICHSLEACRTQIVFDYLRILPTHSVRRGRRHNENEFAVDVSDGGLQELSKRD